MHQRTQNGRAWRSSKAAEVRLCLCLGVHLPISLITSVRFQDCRLLKSMQTNPVSNTSLLRAQETYSLMYPVKKPKFLGGEAPLQNVRKLNVFVGNFSGVLITCKLLVDLTLNRFLITKL